MPPRSETPPDGKPLISSSNNGGGGLHTSRSTSRLVRPSSQADFIKAPSPCSVSGGSSLGRNGDTGNPRQGGSVSWESAFLIWATLSTTCILVLVATIVLTAEGETVASSRGVFGHEGHRPSTRPGQSGKGMAEHQKHTHVRPESVMNAANTTRQRPVVLLFGDSLTERSYEEGGWGARMANHFLRKADVFNRGFGGYNTKWATYILPQIMDSLGVATPLLATVFLGANDAASPTSGSSLQSVSLSDYAANLALLVQYLQSRGVRRIVMLTPPPVFEEGRRKHHASRGTVGTPELDRTNPRTQTYAHACKEAAARLNVPVVDLWTGLQDINDWGNVYLNDGLHLTAAGNGRLFDLLMAVVAQTFPDISPANLPLHYQDWADIHHADPAVTFGPIDPAMEKLKN